MSKIYFIQDENGKYASADNSRRYTKVSGNEIATAMASAEWQSKRFFQASGENERNQIFIEIPKEKIKAFRVEERRSQYLQDIRRNSKYQLVSLDAINGIKGESELTGEEVIADPDADVVAEVMHKIDLETLRKAIRSLSEEEMALITALYLSNTPLTESKYAKQSGIPRMTIHDRKKRILEKLKKYF